MIWILAVFAIWVGLFAWLRGRDSKRAATHRLAARRRIRAIARADRGASDESSQVRNATIVPADLIPPPNTVLEQSKASPGGLLIVVAQQVASLRGHLPDAWYHPVTLSQAFAAQHLIRQADMQRPRLAAASSSIGLLAAATVALASASSCGGLTEHDDVSPRVVCERAGGTWQSDGCNGASDVCGAIACETAIKTGCHCLQPNHCWDPTTERCVLSAQ